MKKSILLSSLAFIFSAQLMASTIVCGDVNSAYVDMDLSESFKARHLSQEQINQYKSEGYSYFIAGRNCGLDSWLSQQQFEVLFMYKNKRLRETIDFGPFSIYGTVIDTNADAGTILNNELVLSGSDKSELSSKTSEIKAEVKSGRGSGALKVIISPIH